MTRNHASVEVKDLKYTLQYEKWHSTNPEHVSAQIRRLKHLFGHFLPPASAVPVLDIGCGMGFTMQMLLADGFTDVTGVDIDQGQIEACRSQGLKVELIHNLAEHLGGMENRLGMAMMIDVLEHLPWDQQLPTLRALFNALKPGGSLIIAVPNATSPVAMRWLYNDYTHFHAFTEHSIDFLLRNAGFEVSRIDASDPALPLRTALAPTIFVKLLSSSNGRQQLKLSLTRWLWKQILDAELGLNVAQLPLGRNLHVLAHKQ
jgi:SAM-dependent methyltransferase